MPAAAHWTLVAVVCELPDTQGVVVVVLHLGFSDDSATPPSFGNNLHSPVLVLQQVQVVEEVTLLVTEVEKGLSGN